MWDAIVVGSGIGGLTAAAALAKRGRRVLVLEQHSIAGGLTQTFQRDGWNFATGVHYIGGVGGQAGPDGQFGRQLDWLSEGRLAFAPCANPYDIVRLPGFEFGIAHPQSAFRDALIARFPAERDAVNAWFEASDHALRSAFTLFALRATPSWLAFGLRLWRGAEARRWAQRTLADELARIANPQLRAVLGARWGDYGAPPASAPFVEHALVCGSYNAGAYYPVGGPARFAEALLPTIEAAGGELRLNADVRRIVTERGHASGVEFAHGDTRRVERTRCVISAMGVANTVACLDAEVAGPWQHAVREMAPGLAYLMLYLGFDGDIAAAGASSANVWVFESDDVTRVWRDPVDEDAPGLFVSFPSLKNPAEGGQPTAEVLAFVDAAIFDPWLALPDAERPEAYLALKAWIAERMLAQFARHFPALMPLLRFHELSTPLTQRRYVRSPRGATYGIEMSAARLTSPALNVKTPVPGLLLAGQDATSPGVQGAFIGGLLAAAVHEPALWAKLRA